MVVRFVCVICVPSCACVSRVCPVCVPAPPRGVFLRYLPGTVPGTVLYPNGYHGISDLKFIAVLTSLYLRDNNIGDDGAKVIAEALKVNPVLTKLVFGGNNIGAEALKVNPVLNTLWLSMNNIGVDGAKAIAEALKVNPVLTSLDLQINSIGVDGAKAIAEALKVNPVLTKLDQSTSSTTIWEMQGKKRCETR